MSSNCYDPELLAEIMEQPEDSPRRNHLDNCPRCRARLATFQEFIASEGECDPARLELAMTRLGNDLDLEIFGEVNTPRPEPGNSIFQRYLDSRITRVVMAMAAMIILFFTLDGLVHRPDNPEILLRANNQSTATNELLLHQTAPLADGAVELSWQGIPDADTYRVKILGTDLRELASFDLAGSTSFRLDPQILADPAFGPGPFAWLVIALNGGDEIARSRPVPMVPGPKR